MGKFLPAITSTLQLHLRWPQGVYPVPIRPRPVRPDLPMVRIGAVRWSSMSDVGVRGAHNRQRQLILLVYFCPSRLNPRLDVRPDGPQSASRGSSLMRFNGWPLSDTGQRKRSPAVRAESGRNSPAKSNEALANVSTPPWLTPIGSACTLTTTTCAKSRKRASCSLTDDYCRIGRSTFWIDPKAGAALAAPQPRQVQRLSARVSAEITGAQARSGEPMTIARHGEWPYSITPQPR